MGWERKADHFPCAPARTREDQLVRPAPKQPPINLYTILKPEPTCNVQEVGEPEADSTTTAESTSNVLETGRKRQYRETKSEPARNEREAGRRKRSPSPMSRRERDQIVKRCLGKLGPTSHARSSLTHKLATFQRERDTLANRAKDFKEMANGVLDATERWVLEDVARRYDRLADKHDLVYQGLRKRL